MGSFSSALKELGFDVKDTESVVKFETIWDIKYPFYTDGFAEVVDWRTMQDANSWLETGVEVDSKLFSTTLKPVEYNPIYKWIMTHKDKCRVFDETKVSHLNYGACCFAFYIRWDKSSRSFVLNADSFCSPFKDLRGLSISRYSTVYGEACVEKLEEVSQRKDCMFIPIIITAMHDTGISVSPASERRGVFMSTLGINLLEADFLRNTIRGIKEDGGFINPRVYYYVTRNYSGVYRIHRDLEKSPRKK